MTMVELVSSSQQELASKVVQELVKRGDEIPERYLITDGISKGIDEHDLFSDKLLIDFSILSSSAQELAKLRSALSEWGCFQVVNHGIESTFLDEVIEVSKEFFELPVEEKVKYATQNHRFLGYGTDVVYNSWNDRITLAIYPEEKRSLHPWPTKPLNFGRVIDEYSRKLINVRDDIFKAMAKSLNISEECFINHQGKNGAIYGRFALYPRCPDPEHIIGGKPHTDATTITIVLPEKQVEGLQVLKDDKWYNVSPIPGALFVNMGDFGEVMSNGIFKSVEHRVVTNSTTDRMSVIAFFHPEEEKKIGPLSELINNHQPHLYKNSTFLDVWQVINDSDEKSRPNKGNILDSLKL